MITQVCSFAQAVNNSFSATHTARQSMVILTSMSRYDFGMNACDQVICGFMFV